jgi:hypothetical protein
MDKIIIGNFEVSEYNGIYSLIAIRHFDGKAYQQWARLELGKNKILSEKSQPMKVLLGNKAESVAAVTQLLAILKQDIPF